MANAKFHIDKKVPIPDKMGGRPRIYPFGAMAVGDSFFVPGQSTANNSASKSAAAHGRAHNKKFTARTVTENGVRGVR